MNAVSGLDPNLWLVVQLTGFIALLVFWDRLWKILFDKTFTQHCVELVLGIFRHSIAEIVRLMKELPNPSTKSFRAGVCGLLVVALILPIAVLLYNMLYPVVVGGFDLGNFVEHISVLCVLAIIVMHSYLFNLNRIVCDKFKK